ncbi:MAG TPA: type I polyketide synthase [Capsulimonadaceae bacterium]
MSETTQTHRESIAIIGLAGRFPGASSADEFWLNLRDGVESITHLSDKDVLGAGISPELASNPDYVKARAVLADADTFDAPFWGFTPRDAEMADPQQRVFMEICWEAMESAGYDVDRAGGAVGVFAGCSMNTYLLSNLLRDRAAVQDLVGEYQVGGYNTVIGNDKDYLATRIAYKLNLTGPAITVQTACSTSLVAICQAVESLRAGACDMALAGAVSISFPQERGYVYQEGGMASPDGHCRTFDAESAGTVFGSGAGVVLLKRLHDATSAGDNILAVIRGAALNNDGSNKVSYLAPSIDGQAAVIEMALRDGGVHPATVSYVEAHGTGTPLGDPIEVAGLTQAYRALGATGTRYCGIGSSKTNIGHLAEASGVTGLIKTVLALQHEMAPPTLHYRAPNPRIEFDASPFRVIDRLTPWPLGNYPRRAGVSSFGVGGTNAHVVLEEAPRVSDGDPGRPVQLLVLSAKTETALQAMSARLADYLEANASVNIADVAYTLQAGRKQFGLRRTVVASNLADAVARLREQVPAVKAGKGGTVAFMFPGQGSQAVNMGRELYESEPTFRADIDACCELLEPHLGLDLRTVLYPAPEQAEEMAAKLSETWLTQPAIFTIEYALAMLWVEWGVFPSALIGHSVGEYVAATLAGVFSLPDALKILATRAKLMQEQPSGAMLAVRVPLGELGEFIGGDVSVAAVNSPSLTVLSGPHEAIASVEARLSEQGKPARRLHTSHAFHSAMMEPALMPFAAAFDGVELNPPAIPFVSNVTGTWITDEQATSPDYWVRHIREAVRFADGVGTLLGDETATLLEVGPGNSLLMLARQCMNGANRVAFSSCDHVTSEGSQAEYIISVLGKLWERGAAVEWDALHSGENRCRIALPTYPFERKRYWVEPANVYATGVRQA